jgi:hypothetical protein
MGHYRSKDRAILKIRGSRVRSLQFMQFLNFVQGTCQWFPEEGTVNLERWKKVGDRLMAQYTAEGLECMPIFTFGLWSMIRDCLVPTPSHKQRFSSSVSNLTPGDMPSVSEGRNGICRAQHHCQEQADPRVTESL